MCTIHILGLRCDVRGGVESDRFLVCFVFWLSREAPVGAPKGHASPPACWQLRTGRNRPTARRVRTLRHRKPLSQRKRPYGPRGRLARHSKLRALCGPVRHPQYHGPGSCDGRDTVSGTVAVDPSTTQLLHGAGAPRSRPPTSGTAVNANV